MNEAGYLDVAQLRAVARKSAYSSQSFARELGVCPRDLRRQMRMRFGVTTRDWIKEQRLLAAAEELRAIRVVKRVASSFGFPSVSQFSREFRHWFCITPSVFLKRGL